jgi:hypothetical protein
MSYANPIVNNTIGGQTTQFDQAISPFINVNINDPNQSSYPQIVDTLTISLSANNGTLSLGPNYYGPSVLSGSGTLYTITDLATSLTYDIENLLFTPNAAAIGSSTTTTFTLTDASVLNGVTVATSPADSTTTVTDSDPLTEPTITGAHGSQVTYWETPVTPFSSVNITDPNAGTTEKLTITLTGGGGTLADGAYFYGTSTLSGGGGVYTLTGTAVDVNTELQRLKFTPTAGAANTSTTTSFTLTDQVMQNGVPLISATDSTTSVIDHDTPVAPTLQAFNYISQTVFQQPVTPFSYVLITDLNPGTTEQLTIALSGAGGTLADGAYFNGQSTLQFSNGVYTLTGTVSDVLNELTNLTFTPSLGALNSTRTTTFTLTDNAIKNGAVFAAGTPDSSIVLTDDNSPIAPTISGTSGRQATFFQAAIAPFASVVVDDPDPYATDQLTIALSGGGGTLADGPAFTGTSSLSFANGVYTLTGTLAQVQGELRALKFIPVVNAAGAAPVTTFTLTDNSIIDGAVAAAGVADSTTKIVDVVPPTTPGLAILDVWGTTLANAPAASQSGAVTLVGANDPALAGQIITLFDGADAIGSATASAQGGWTANVTLPASAAVQNLTAQIGATTSAVFAYQPGPVTGSWIGVTSDTINTIVGSDAAGDVVGNYYSSSAGTQLAFILKNGAQTTISGIGSGERVTALGVDQAGDVLATEYNSSTYKTDYFLYTAQGAYLALPTTITPVGIDGAGNVYAVNGGVYEEIPGGTGTPIVLPSLGASLYAGSLAVDQAGDIYGTSNSANVVLFKGAASATTITFPDAQTSNTTITGVANGAVFGTYYDLAAGVIKGFIEQNGVYQTVAPPGANDVSVLGVTASGAVFGNFNYTSAVAYGYGNHGYVEQNGVFSVIAAPGAIGTTLQGVTASGSFYGTYEDAKFNTYGFVAQNGVYETLDLPGLQSSSMLIGVDDNGVAYGDFIGVNSVGSFTAQNGAYVSSTVNSDTTLLWGVDGAGDTFGSYIDATSVSHGFADIGGVVTTIDIPAALGGASFLTTVAGQYNGAFYGFYDLQSGVLGSFVDQGGAFTPIAVAGASSTWAIGGAFGKVFGLYIDSANVDHGFIYDLAAKTYTTLDAPGGSSGGGVQTPSIKFAGGLLSLGAGSGVSGMDAQGNFYGTYVDAQGVAHGYEDANGVFTTLDAPGAADTVITRVSDNGTVVGTYFAASGAVFGFSETGGQFTSYQFTSSASPQFVSAGQTGDTIYGYVSDYVAAVQTAPCYCRGTRIATSRGDVAVEDLRIGDLALTQDGALRPVVWIGRRAIEITRHPAPRDVRPVLIAAGAFGEKMPRRDLWVSPGHNIAAEGALMPACALVNGISVRQVEAPRVEYFHVELDAHDILLAEGLPAESYLDCGNRTDFSNGGAFVAAHPDFKPRHWAQTCLPLVKEGPEVERTKARLLGVLQERGHELTAEADACVIADGARIAPVLLSENRLAFFLPEPLRDIVLNSRAFTPAHVLPASTDDRSLGLCVARVQIDGEDIALDAADLAEGWHDPEGGDGAPARRWTNGAARLRPGARFVIVDLGGSGLYWRAPGDAVVALFG